MDEYLRRLTLVKADWFTKPGVSDVHVAHDLDCPSFVGRECRCDPDIILTNPSTGKFSVDADGNLTRVS